MNQRFLEAAAMGLAERSVATLRFQFPYMEAGRGRPDSPAVATAAVRAAAGEAARLANGLPLFAGGKSFGGRMTSTAESETHLEGVSGLFFLGFPLHAPGKASSERGEHLKAVKIPMLFLQGTRDDFAKLEQLEPVVKGLGRKATLRLFEGADLSFHVPKTSGRTDAEILTELLDTTAEWAQRLAAGPRTR
jgi:predicted alpha/beta-hydrolase family hydrolase